jgi:transposase-like protein
MCDFEKAQRNGAKLVWPELDVRGCMFHMIKALREHTSTKIKKDKRYNIIFKMFTRLPLLPLNRIMKGYQELLNLIQKKKFKKVFVKFLTYFDLVWIKRYPKNEWAVSDLQFRTNNHLEGTNNLIKKIIPRNPAPFKFLKGLLDLISRTTNRLFSDIQRSSQQTDKSKLTIPFETALVLLDNDEINEIEFLMMLAKV